MSAAAAKATPGEAARTGDNVGGAEPVDDSPVRVENLDFSRGERPIFAGLSLRIRRGQITAIMGPSGTGKTTLLKLIGGQIRPDAGRILVEGTDIAGLGRKALFAVRERMGMLFQSGALFTDMNLFENVAFPLRVHTRLPEEMIRDLVLIKLQSVGLRGAQALMPSELSGGMARRAALARALALDPDLMMYDEPFTGQDPIAMGILVKLIKSLNRALGHTSIVVSHDIQETLSIADYIYLVADARLVAEGTPTALLEDESPRVKQFMQGLPDGPVPFHYEAPPYLDSLLGEAADA